MTNEELKKKICDIIAPYVSAYGDDERIADALIAAGIGDVETVQKIAASATAMAVLEAAKAEHRAEVAERALENEIKNRINITGDVEGLVYTYYGRAIYQAEKELAELKGGKG